MRTALTAAYYPHWQLTFEAFQFIFTFPGSFSIIGSQTISYMRLFTTIALLSCLSCFANADTGRLASLSTRVTCQTGDSVAVSEFILQGMGSETVLMRALGPSLKNFGVPDALPNPTALFLNPRGRVLDQNNNWMSNPDKDAIIATGIAPTDPREAAMIDSLAPGAYTFVEEGVRQTTGAVLSEVYDLADGSLQLSAAGTRGLVLDGDEVMISGFILNGNGPTSLLIRALGPSLADSGLSGVLSDPYITLYNPNGDVILTDDNWRDTQEQEIMATGLAPSDDLESAMVVKLTPGAYTVVFSGVGGATGLGFLQLYNLGFPAKELNPAPVIGRGH